MKKSPATSPPEGPANRPVMFSLLNAARALELRLEETLSSTGLSGAKLAALTKLAQAEEPLSLTELAARLTCVRSNITQLVDRLEADGLVRRVDDPRDRRSIRAELTPLGRERQAEGARKLEELQNDIARRLSEVDCCALDLACRKLR